MKTRYGIPEIAAITAAAAAVTLLLVFMHGWLKIIAAAPATILALLLYHGSVHGAWDTWTKITRAIVMPVGMVLLTFGFVFGVGLTALITRIFRIPLLAMKFEEKKSYWVERKKRGVSLEAAKKPF